MPIFAILPTSATLIYRPILMRDGSPDSARCENRGFYSEKRSNSLPGSAVGTQSPGIRIFSDFRSLHYFLASGQIVTAYELFVYEIPVVEAHPQVPDRKGKNVIKDIRRRPWGPKIWISWKSSSYPGV